MDEEEEAETNVRLAAWCVCVSARVQEEALQRALRESRQNLEHDPKHGPQLADSEWLFYVDTHSRSGSSSANGYRGPPRI